MTSVNLSSAEDQRFTFNPPSPPSGSRGGQVHIRARGRGSGGNSSSSTRGGAPSASHPFDSSTIDAQTSTWRGRGQGRGRGRGNGRGEGTRGRDKPPRPTHFLALPLHTHSTLRARVAAFQTALLESDLPVKGLDRTIVIDPRRLHLTLGVMPLENEAVVASYSAGASKNVSKRTPEKALELLRSLQPSIASILSDTGGGVGVKVPLEELFVFPPGATTGANVLWLGPDMRGIDDVKLRRHGQSPNTPLRSEPASRDETRRWKERLWKVSDFIHQEFKKAGYITENRPLKLHCTILNTSHRRPRRRETFSYTDVLKSPARALIETERQHGLEDQATGSEEIRSRMTSNPNRSSASEQRGVPNASRADRSSGPYPLPVNLGVYDVNEVQLWVMGSRGPNGEYVSLGGIKLE